MGRGGGLIEEAITRPKCQDYYKCMSAALRDHGVFTCILCNWYNPRNAVFQ
jgi:hypothetical protein